MVVGSGDGCLEGLGVGERDGGLVGSGVGCLEGFGVGNGVG